MTPFHRDPSTGHDVDLTGARGQVDPVRDVHPDPEPDEETRLALAEAPRSRSRGTASRGRSSRRRVGA